MSEKSILEKIKETGSHSIIYGLGAALQSALGFILIPLYTRYYTTDIYGALSLINLCGTVASTLFYMGASSALARSYYDYVDVYERKKVVSTSLYIALFGASCQVAFGVLLCSEISIYLFHDSRYSFHISLVLSSMAISILNNLFYLLLRFKRKSKQVVTLNVLSLILSCSLIVYFLLYLKLGILAPILGSLISQGAVCVVLIYLVADSIVLGYCRREIKIQLTFGLQTVIAGLTYYSLDWLNRLFINKYCSLGDVGIYSLGSQISMVITIILVVPFCQIWAPMRMQYRHDNNADEFYARILTYFLIAGFSISVSVSLFSKEVITILAGHKEYVEACKVVPFLSIGLMLFGSTYIIDHGIYFSRKAALYTYIYASAALLSLGLNYLFVPRYGYLAASINIMICYLLIVVLVFKTSNRLYKVPYERDRLVSITGISIAAMVIGYAAQFDSIFASILYKSLVLVFMFSSIYSFVLSLSEKERIINLLAGVKFWKIPVLKA